MNEIELTNRSLVALMAAIIHAVNYEKIGVTPKIAVEVAERLLETVEKGPENV